MLHIDSQSSPVFWWELLILAKERKYSVSILEVPKYCQNFRSHFQAGTGRKETGGVARKPWYRRDFLAAYEAALKELEAPGAVISDRTLRDWLSTPIRKYGDIFRDRIFRCGAAFPCVEAAFTHRNLLLAH